MSLSLRPVVAGLAVTLAAIPAGAGAPRPAIAVSAAWARPTPPGAAAGAGYLTLTNTGARPDRLIGATSPAAREVQVHSMTIDHGVAHMAPVAGGLVVPAHGSLTLAPGGYHLMLIGPVRPLTLGGHIPATLRFERAGSVRIAFTVRATAPAGGR